MRVFSPSWSLLYLYFKNPFRRTSEHNWSYNYLILSFFFLLGKVGRIIMLTFNQWINYIIYYGLNCIKNTIHLPFRTKITQKISNLYTFWDWSTTRSEHTITSNEHRNRLFLVISWLEIENNALTSVNPLKFRFKVLPKSSKKWHFILTLVIWKKTYLLIIRPPGSTTRVWRNQIKNKNKLS